MGETAKGTTLAGVTGIPTLLRPGGWLALNYLALVATIVIWIVYLPMRLRPADLTF